MVKTPRPKRRKEPPKKTDRENRRTPKPAERLPSADTNRIRMQTGINLFRNDPLQKALLERPTEFYPHWQRLILGQMDEATYNALAIELRIRVPKSGLTPYLAFVRKIRKQGQ